MIARIFSIFSFGDTIFFKLCIFTQFTQWLSAFLPLSIY